MLFPNAGARGPVWFAPRSVDLGQCESKMPPERFPLTLTEAPKNRTALESHSSCIWGSQPLVKELI